MLDHIDASGLERCRCGKFPLVKWQVHHAQVTVSGKVIGFEKHSHETCWIPRAPAAAPSRKEQP